MATKMDADRDELRPRRHDTASRFMERPSTSDLSQTSSQLAGSALARLLIVEPRQDLAGLGNSRWPPDCAPGLAGSLSKPAQAPDMAVGTAISVPDTLRMQVPPRRLSSRSVGASGTALADRVPIYLTCPPT